MSKVSLAIGGVLWLGATCLLVEDAWHQGHATASHLMMPLLTAGTVAAAVVAHHRIASLRLLSGVGFALLALLGSVATVYGTMGRTAETRDLRAAAAEATNRALATRRHALTEARRSAADAEAEVLRECRTGFGKSCAGWTSALSSRQQELRRIEAELSSMQSAPVDPKGEAVAELAALLGADGERVRAIVSALDPVVLPLFLELGSILFFGAAFPHAKARESVREDFDAVSDGAEVVSDDEATFTRDEALQDLLKLIGDGAVTDGRLLSRRWGVSDSTASRWLGSWSRAGLIGRARDGRSRRPTSAA